MSEDVKTAALNPVVVTVISGTGDGNALTTGTTGKTPSGQPNLVVTVVGPVLAIFVRFVNAYLTMLVGLVAAGMTSDAIPSKDFLDLVMKCAGLSIAGAGLGLLKDLVTVFGRLEQRWPLSTGSV